MSNVTLLSSRGTLQEIMHILLWMLVKQLENFTAADVVQSGGRKTSPRTSTIVQFIFYCGPLRSA